jgi:hypothetical protein
MLEYPIDNFDLIDITPYNAQEILDDLERFYRHLDKVIDYDKDGDVIDEFIGIQNSLSDALSKDKDAILKEILSFKEKFNLKQIKEDIKELKSILK